MEIILNIAFTMHPQQGPKARGVALGEGKQEVHIWGKIFFKICSQLPSEISLKIRSEIC